MTKQNVGVWLDDTNKDTSHDQKRFTTGFIETWSDSTDANTSF